MSYILDALKKSEQERPRHQIPGLACAPVAPATAKPTRAVWIWLIPLLLSVNIALLLWPDETENHTAETINAGQISTGTLVARPPADTSNNAPMPYSSPPVTRLATPPNYHRDPFAPLPMQENVTAKESSSTELTSDRLPARSDKPTARTRPALDLSLLNQSLLNQSIMNQALIAQLTPPPAQRHSAAHTQATIAPLTPPGSQAAERALPAARAESDSRAAVPVPVPAAIPELSELSASQRTEIAPLNISVHIYTANPAERMARINGRMVHEGHSLAPGLQLEEITPHALIFRYQEQRFQLKR